MKSSNLEKVGIGSIVVGFIGLLVLSPVLTFGCAYLGGMILNFFVGNMVTNGLNVVFDTNRFTSDLIPLVCATLATIGKYFRSTQTNNNNK
jgi:ABC-type phosphate transport system permease subunit